MAKRGRPSNYDPELHPLLAWGLAIDGKTDKEIAEGLGISERTLNAWKKEHEEFSQSLKDGKRPADARVEKSLYQRAVGYTQKEKKVIQTIDKNGNPKPARIEIIEKPIPPDVTAQIYWLKNRRPDKYRDKQEVTVDDTNITFSIVPASKRTVEDDD